MAQRGRKPKERKGYFYEKEETAIIQYIHEENIEEKNRIFNTVIYPALTKMIESIIRRYKLFVPDEDFDQNFNDTISYLLTKINHFKPQITGYDLIENEKEIAKHHFVMMTEEDLKQKLRDASEEDPEYVVVYLVSMMMTSLISIRNIIRRKHITIKHTLIAERYVKIILCSSPHNMQKRK